MMDTIKHAMNGYRIPSYMEEILTHNYCPHFVRMSMIRDGQSYRFSYRPGSMTRLNIQNLDIYEKLVLLRSLITINESAGGYLIGAENYLLEPELIYTSDGSPTVKSIRILFYPDVKKLRFPEKMMRFTERIKEGLSKEEREILTQLTDTIDTGDMNRARMFLDKNILRIESRSYSKAG